MSRLRLVSSWRGPHAARLEGCGGRIGRKQRIIAKNIDWN